MMQRQNMWRLARVIATTMGGLLIGLSLLFLLRTGAVAADVTSMAVPAHVEASTRVDMPDATPCSTIKTVSLGECLALGELFTTTNGPAWITNTNWLNFKSGNAPCDWYGVGCSGGHVRALLLAKNELSGTLPLSIGNLRGLLNLRLEKNNLFGRIPPTICNLTPNLTDFSIAYNAFFTLRKSVETCLQPLESDWLATQTTTPRELSLTEITTGALHLAWTPISYTGDGGYYEVGLATHIEGPFFPHGHTKDKIDASYVVTGLQPGRTYYIRVRSYTPAHDDHPSDVRSVAANIIGVTQATSGRVLLAAYFPADNDLSPEIDYVVERFRAGTVNNPNVQVVLLVDGDQDGDTRVLEMAHGEIVTTDDVMKRWGDDELDTADPEVLTWFLQNARAKFPSERTVAALMGHGIPLAPELDFPATTGLTAGDAILPAALSSGEIPPLPKEHDYTPSDITSRSYMSAVDVGQALLAATDQGQNPFDIVFFDQCFQGNLDILYEARNTARVFVASPNYAWLAAAYDRYMTRFTPTATPEEMAQAIIEWYRFILDPRHPNTIFWVRNSDLLNIANSVSTLADALSKALQANQQERIAEAVRQSQYVDTTQCGTQNLQLGPPDELIGIESLGLGLQTTFGAGDPFGIALALDDLQAAISKVSKRTIEGRPYIAPSEFWDYTNSLTILAPLPRASASDVAWRASTYRGDVPFQAIWTIDPSQPVTVTTSLAYVRDGRWDEFLAEWYTNLTPTVGQWCQYIPPQQVVVTETEVITLNAKALTSNSLQLEWTPTDDTSATEYWLYVQGPYDIGWKVGKILPIHELRTDFTELDGGNYRYMVLAHNEAQELIAQSNEVTIEISGVVTAPELPPLRLPLVIRSQP